MSVEIKVYYNLNKIHNSLISWSENKKLTNEINNIILEGLIVKTDKDYIIITPWIIELLYSDIYMIYNDKEIKLNILKYDKYLHLVTYEITDKEIILERYIIKKKLMKNRHYICNIFGEINSEDHYYIKNNNESYNIKNIYQTLEYINIINISKLYILSCDKDDNIDKIIKLGNILYKNNDKNIIGMYMEYRQDKYTFIPTISILKILEESSYLFHYNYDIYNNMIIMTEGLLKDKIIKSLDNKLLIIDDKDNNNEIMILDNKKEIPIKTYFMYNTKSKINVEYYDNELDIKENKINNMKIKLININNLENYKDTLNTKILEYEDLTIIEFNPLILNWLNKFNILLINNIIDDYINNPFDKKYYNKLIVIDIKNQNLLDKLNKDNIDIKIDYENEDIKYICSLEILEINNIKNITFEELKSIKKINDIKLLFNENKYII